jgi:hypothetical protein
VVPVIDTAQAANALDRRLVAEMATEGVTRIGRQRDDAALAYDLGRPLQQPALRVVRMN